jgi:hypothetical protein
MRLLRRAAALAALVFLAAGVEAHAKATPPPGGANQKPSLEGCANTWLFNGVWRLRATAIGPIEDFGTKGLGVRVEARNGTSRPLQLGTSGVDGQGAGIALVGADGSALNVDAGAFQTQLGYKTVVQGGAITATLRFHIPNGTDPAAFTPVKLIVQFDQRNVQVPGVRYASAKPSLRINLTCGLAPRASSPVPAPS